MQGLAPYANTEFTFPPVTDAPDVVIAWIGQEDIASPVDVLSMAFQSPSYASQRFQVSIIRYRHKQVSIFRFLFIGY